MYSKKSTGIVDVVQLCIESTHACLFFQSSSQRDYFVFETATMNLIFDQS